VKEWFLCVLIPPKKTGVHTPVFSDRFPSVL